MWLYPEGPLRTAQPYANAYVRDKGTIRLEIISATFHRRLSSNSVISLRLTHAKTKNGNRSRTMVKTDFVVGESVDGDGNRDDDGANSRFTWLQKFQLVSEKLSLGDSNHEQVRALSRNRSSSSCCTVFLMKQPRSLARGTHTEKENSTNRRFVQLNFELELQEGSQSAVTSHAARQARSYLTDKSKTCWVGGIPVCEQHSIDSAQYRTIQYCGTDVSESQTG